MDKWGTNFDDQIACGSGNVAIGLGGNDWLYSVPGTGPFDQVLVGGAGNDTYIAAPNAATVIVEKGGGYDILNASINAGSMDSYIYTIGWDLLVMGDYRTGCTILIPDATEFAIETINFLDASFNFKDFFMAARQGMANLNIYSNNATYYMYNLASAYSAAAERPESIGQNQVFPPAPEPIPPAPEPALPSAIDLAVAQFFNEAQYLQNKAAALHAGGMEISVDETAQAIASAGFSSWDHYRTFGAFERNAAGELGIDPSVAFDSSKYYDAKVALCAANGEQFTPEQLAVIFQSMGIDPVTHYALFGQAEGIPVQPVTPVGLDAPDAWPVA